MPGSARPESPGSLIADGSCSSMEAGTDRGSNGSRRERLAGCGGPGRSQAPGPVSAHRGQRGGDRQATLVQGASDDRAGAPDRANRLQVLDGRHAG